MDGKPDVMALLTQVRQEVSLLQPPAYNRTLNTFGHIFFRWLRCRVLQLQMGRSAVSRCLLRI